MPSICTAAATSSHYKKRHLKSNCIASTQPTQWLWLAPSDQQISMIYMGVPNVKARQPIQYAERLVSRVVAKATTGINVACTPNHDADGQKHGMHGSASLPVSSQSKRPFNSVHFFCTPPPSFENNTKITKSHGNGTLCCSDRGGIYKGQNRTCFQKLGKQHPLLL